MFKKIAGSTLVALSLSGGLQAQQMIYPDTMVVLDVSNSMWGQIDGVSKMEIARGVIGDLLGDLQTESEFGLIAYGHRQTGSCEDIELILPIGRLDGAEFSAAVNQLQPRGRTPLTAAVAMAADVMNSETRSARIILLTDGLESCEQDPCALATSLEESGLDFTTHVIGFGVSEITDQSQISCLAENTGGVYLTAETADELTSALQFMATPQDQPMMTLTALDRDGNVIDNENIEWSIFNVTEQEMWLNTETGASVMVDYQADVYRATALLFGESAELEFTFDGSADATFNVVFAAAEDAVADTSIATENTAPEILVSEGSEDNSAVRLNAPQQVDPGQDFEISWAGPSNSGDYLAIAKPEDVVTSFFDYARTSAGSPAVLTAPNGRGEFELRYISPTTNDIVATETIIIGDIEINLIVPNNITTNSSFIIEWQGVLFEGDQLVLVSENAGKEDIISAFAASDDQQVTFRAPETPGIFAIQFQDKDGKILKTTNLEVKYAAALDATPATTAGSSIIIEWSGPDLEGDFVAIVPVGYQETVFGSFSYTRDGAQLRIITTDLPGDYEIRYYLGADDSILASLPLTLSKPEVEIDTISDATAGETISVSWVGPDNQNDFLTVVPENASEGASNNIALTRQGSPLSIQLPTEPGAYEVRYVTGQSGLTLMRAKINITAEPTLLFAEPTAVAGSTVVVRWQGPETNEDLITLVPFDANDETLGNFTYASEGNDLGIISKDTLGDFEIRYVSGDNGAILARLPITMLPPPVTVSAQSAAVAGETIAIKWFGPDDDEDYVTIVPVNTAEGEYGNYTYTRNGTPLDLMTKDMAGAYEIRYISGETKETLARTLITLIAPVVEIEARPQAIAGAEINATWTGPDNQNDFITVVPTGTDSGDYGNFTYTSRGASLTVLTPDEPGNYEVRYISGQSFITLASIPITLSPPNITIDASPVGIAGEMLEVIWTGPSHKNDFLTIVSVGADINVLGTFQYTRKGNPLNLLIPAETGPFEIRYVSGQSMRVLQSLPLTILAP